MRVASEDAILLGGAHLRSPDAPGTADVMEISPQTVVRDWEVARVVDASFVHR